VATNVAEEPAASIFRIYMSQAGRWGGYIASVEGMVHGELENWPIRAIDGNYKMEP
jgi:hypothetical protein